MRKKVVAKRRFWIEIDSHGVCFDNRYFSLYNDDLKDINKQIHKYLISFERRLINEIQMRKERCYYWLKKECYRGRLEINVKLLELDKRYDKF